jgi:hypothetical protein
MDSVARAEHVLYKFEHHGFVSAQNRTFNFNRELANLQKAAIGFVNGASATKSNSICKSGLVNMFDSIVELIDNRWVWLPDY